MLPTRDNQLPRITFRHLGGYLLEEFNLQRGIGYTFKKWLLSPRKAAAEYLFVDRRRMMKPLPLLLLMATVTTLLSFYFLDIDRELSPGKLDGALPARLARAVSRVLPLIQQYFHIALLSNLPAQALATYFIFRKARLFYPEHLVINMYLACVQYLFVLPAIPLLERFPVYGTGISLISLGYQYFALTHIFEQTWLRGLLKFLGVFLLTQIFYSLLLTLIILILANF